MPGTSKQIAARSRMSVRVVQRVLRGMLERNEAERWTKWHRFELGGYTFVYGIKRPSS